MVRTSRQRGWSASEFVIALTVITVIAAMSATAQPAGPGHAASSLRLTAARRAAASILESASADPAALVSGAADVPLDADTRRTLEDPHAERTVVEREPGLLEVRADVTWVAPGGERAHVELTTLVATESGR